MGRTWQKGPEKPQAHLQVPSGMQVPRPRQVMLSSHVPAHGCRLQRFAVEGLMPGHSDVSTFAPLWSMHVTVLVETPPAADPCKWGLFSSLQDRAARRLAGGCLGV